MTDRKDAASGVAPAFASVARAAQESRRSLLAERARAATELPLRYWRQQAHFTTPASGAPAKAIRGLDAVPRLLERFGIDLAQVARRSGASADALQAVLDGSPHAPLVMVDAEDAVALTDSAATQARRGAIDCFTGAEWGPTLAFFRPAGLGLESCVEDLLCVLPEAARGRDAADYPIDGVIWPKAEHPGELGWLCEILDSVEAKLGLPEHRIRVQFLVESGYALNQLAELAQACLPRLAGIIWGIADYSADANLPAIRNDHPLCDWARYEIVNIAGAVGVPAIDCMTLMYPTPVHRGGELTATQVEENRQRILDALAAVYRDARHGADLGMAGKWVGHPLQLWMVLAAYREVLGGEQVLRDLAEIEAYQSSVEAGAGATIIGEGASAYMADRATDRHLRMRLRRAAAWGLLPASQAEQLGLISAAERADLDGSRG